MIKSSKVSIKFSNVCKKDSYHNLIKEYKMIVSKFIDILWLEILDNENTKIPSLLPKKYTDKIETQLTTRMIQCAGKQASGIVRGTVQKQKRRAYVIGKLKAEGKSKQSKKLQSIYDKVNYSKPSLNNVNPVLDNRFFETDLNNKTIFDGWITLKSIGNKEKIKLPFKRHKHFNNLFEKGKILNSIVLGKREVTYVFDIQEDQLKTKGDILGIDIGETNTVSCSNGFATGKNKHGHDITSISNILSRKKKGSKGFAKTQTHRNNYINWSINQIDLKDVRQVNREGIKNLRKFRRTNRRLSHWTYADIFEKLDSYCGLHGVRVTKMNPTYTSQRCSECGWVRKSNRNRKQFKCNSCGYAKDADLNASINISLSLVPIGTKQRLQHKNKEGFYWNVVGQESIVPVTQKANVHFV